MFVVVLGFPKSYPHDRVVLLVAAATGLVVVVLVVLIVESFSAVRTAPDGRPNIVGRQVRAPRLL